MLEERLITVEELKQKQEEEKSHKINKKGGSLLFYSISPIISFIFVVISAPKEVVWEIQNLQKEVIKFQNNKL